MTDGCPSAEHEEAVVVDMWADADGRGLVEISSDAPELDAPVLLHYFDGFLDAGSAGRLLTEHLLEESDHEVVARFDVDRLIDYRARRPPMTFAVDHWESYEAPELAVHLLRDAVDTPFLLATGPEPDREWERFTAAMMAVARHFHVRLAVGYHGIPMGVPHTRTLGVTAHATRPDLVAGHQPIANRLQVPGSIGGLLEFRLGQAGRDAVGFAVHVPHYLAQAAYPPAAVSGLEAVRKATGLDLPDDALRRAARRAQAEVDRQVSESADVARVVQDLERQYDAFMNAAGLERPLVDPAEPMPTADELAAQFEAFLAEQRGDSSDG